MTIIELGYVDADEAPHRPPLDRRRIRPAAAASVVLLCLATLTTSIPATAHGLQVLWSASGLTESDFTVVGDAVVVMSGPDNKTLTAYGLADGAERWTHELPEAVPYIDAARDSRVLLLPTGERQLSNDQGITNFFTSTLALDAGTGAELWRAAGTATSWPVTGTALVEKRTADGVGITQLRLVRLTDGALVWSRETPGAQRWIALGAEPGHPDRVALVSGDGDVQVLRLADGTEAGAGRVEWDPGRPEDGDYIGLIAEGDALYVLRTSRGRSTVTAYSDRSLHKLWGIDQPANGSGGYWCEAVLCLGVKGELVGYDWASGAVRWRFPGAEYAIALGAGLLLAESQDPDAREVLLDAATGRELADLGTADAPFSFDGGVFLTLGNSTSPLGRTVVTRLDPRTGESFPLGTIEAIADWGCQLVGKLLVCHHPQGKLTVTAVG